MKKTKLLLAGMLSALAFVGAKAQVKDVSVVVSPLAEYNWWNENIALKNSWFYGGRIGFGFGPFFELRGTFEKSLNLKNQLEGKSWNIFNEETLQKLEGMEIDVTRIGGEAKINILPSYSFTPYITAGTGVQIFDYNPFDSSSSDGAISDAKSKEKQIYLSLGAGVMMNLNDRMAFSLEAKNIRFNMDANNSYINPTVSEDKKQWGNFALMAGLDFYLGGNTKVTDQYGRAYRNIFTDGFAGPKFVMEPGVAYVDFHKNMGLKDQWFMGGAVGVDFSSLVGLRAFYYQATKNPNQLSFDFNKDMKMYGANVIARLNYPRGIVPYLTFGAGYLDVNNFIDNPEDKKIDKRNLFALGGAGIEVPVSRYLALYGSVNSMLTVRRVPLEGVQKPSDLLNNMLYTAGLRVNIGQPAEAPAYETGASQSDIDRINSMRQDNTRTRLFGRQAPKSSDYMTKKEFEAMVDRILEKIRKEESLRASQFSDSEMNVILAALAAQNKPAAAGATNQEVLNEMRDLVRKMDSNYTAMSARPATTAPSTTIITTGSNQQPTTPQTIVVPADSREQKVVVGSNANSPESAPVVLDSRSQRSKYTFNQVALFTGINFGHATQWNVGVRGYMPISDTALYFMPELYASLGSKTGFGISGNVVYNFAPTGPVSPYVGLGLGLFNHSMGTHFGPNIIVGANLNTVANGALFVDYSARNLFKNNQVAVGYRFFF